MTSYNITGIWLGTPTLRRTQSFVVSNDNVNLCVAVVATGGDELTVNYNTYLNGTLYGQYHITLKGDGEERVYVTDIQIPTNVEGQTMSFKAVVGNQTSPTISMPGINGIPVPTGQIGVCAIRIPASEQEIHVNSDNEGWVKDIYLHPTVYVQSKLKENRKVSCEYFVDSLSINYPDGWRRRLTLTIKSTEPEFDNDLLLHGFDSEIYTLKSTVDIFNVTPQIIGSSTMLGDRQAAASVVITEYFGTEQPGEAMAEKAVCDFTVIDDSPNQPQIAVSGTSLNPETNTVDCIIKNVGGCNIWVEFYGNYFITVDGQRISDGSAEYSQTIFGLNVGEEFKIGAGGWDVYKFTPTLGQTYVICVYCDETDEITYTKNGLTFTDKVVNLYRD